MLRDRLDVLVVVAITILQIGFTLAGTAGPIRVVVGLIFVLSAPGYALVLAGWPARRAHWPQRLVLSLGVSLALEALSGLLLNLTEPGLRPETWTALLAPITLVACLIGLARRPPDAGWLAVSRPAASTLGSTLATIGIVVSAYAVATSGALTTDQQQGFSQMWLLPNEAQPGSYRLGIRNLELQPTTYRVQVLADTEVALDIAGVQLGPGQAWEAAVTMPASYDAAGTIDAVAYRTSDEAPYRRVRLVTRQPQG